MAQLVANWPADPAIRVQTPVRLNAFVINSLFQGQISNYKCVELLIETIN